MDEDDHKRARPLDHVIKQTLDEEAAQKRARKAEKSGVVVGKGKTLQQIEEEEGGPVKESLVNVAQAKRAADRKKAALHEDTDIPAEVDRYEEDQVEVEEEGGVKFMAFSLKEEREIGHFDEEGNYVEKRVGREDRDAWLESTEVVDDKVKQLIEQRKKAEEEAQAGSRVAPMTDRQIAMAKNEMSQHMLPGETVTRALKRIRGADSSTAGHRVLSKREKQRQQAAGEQQQAGQGDLELFNRLTEILDQLFAEGEMDMYTTTKEELDRSAAMWLPKQSAPSEQAKGSAPAVVDADLDDDMFGEEDDKPSVAAAAPAAETSSAPATGQDAGGQADGAGAPPGSSAVPTAVGSLQWQDDTPRTDFSSWPIKELKRYLQENGVDASDIVEKEDLIAQVKETEEQVLAAAAAAAAAAAGGAGDEQIPVGYVFDPASGYWHNQEAGMYYDASSRAFYDGTTWLRFDSASGSYVPLEG